jgi:hypothetical protein
MPSASKLVADPGTGVDTIIITYPSSADVNTSSNAPSRAASRKSSLAIANRKKTVQLPEESNNEEGVQDGRITLEIIPDAVTRESTIVIKPNSRAGTVTSSRRASLGASPRRVSLVASSRRASLPISRQSSFAPPRRNTTTQLLEASGADGDLEVNDIVIEIVHEAIAREPSIVIKPVSRSSTMPAPSRISSNATIRPNSVMKRSQTATVQSPEEMKLDAVGGASRSLDGTVLERVAGGPAAPVLVARRPHMGPSLMALLRALGFSKERAMAKLIKWRMYQYV